MRIRFMFIDDNIYLNILDVECPTVLFDKRIPLGSKAIKLSPSSVTMAQNMMLVCGQTQGGEG